MIGPVVSVSLGVLGGLAGWLIAVGWTELGKRGFDSMIESARLGAKGGPTDKAKAAARGSYNYYLRTKWIVPVVAIGFRLLLPIVGGISGWKLGETLGPNL